MSRSVPPYERRGAFRPIEDASLRTHVFRRGETLWALAHRYYDDWRLAPLIAEKNDLDDVGRIAPGTILLIPAAPIKRGLFESV